MRKLGLTIDNLLSCDVVTADGRLVVASADAHEDLFWGLRGGGGNFGIVTSFEYEVHPVGPTVLAGMLLYPLDQAADVLAYFRDYVAQAPDEVGILGNLRLGAAAAGRAAGTARQAGRRDGGLLRWCHRRRRKGV